MGFTPGIKLNQSTAAIATMSRLFTALVLSALASCCLAGYYGGIGIGIRPYMPLHMPIIHRPLMMGVHMPMYGGFGYGGYGGYGGYYGGYGRGYYGGYGYGGDWDYDGIPDYLE